MDQNQQSNPNTVPEAIHCGSSFEQHVFEVFQGLKLVGAGLGCQGTLQAMAEMLDWAKRTFPTMDLTVTGKITDENTNAILQKGAKELRTQIEAAQFANFEKTPAGSVRH